MKRTNVVLWLFAGALLLTACSGQKQQAPESAPEAEETAVKTKQELREMEEKVKEISTLSREGKQDEALPLARELITEDPHDAKNYVRTAHLYEVQKDYDKALAVLEEADGVSHGRDMVVRKRAEIHIGQGDFDTAIALLDKMAEGFPDGKNPRVLGEAEANLLYARAYAGKGAAAKARQHVDQALSLLDPANEATRTLYDRCMEMRKSLK